MFKIEGTAKKHDGTAIDYVSIFNWADGKCIVQVTPDVVGHWEYKPFNDLRFGVTYVADGCEPITHGAYDFIKPPIPNDTILHYDFNGDVLDKSSNALHGIKTGNTSFVLGRREGSQALNFVSGCVKTPQVLPINSDKLTVSFWMLADSDFTGMIYETSSVASKNNGATYCIANGSPATGVRSLLNTNDTYNEVVSSITIGEYCHIFIEIDRSKGADDENKIYVNNILNLTSYADSDKDMIGDLTNHILYIGQRNASQLSFKGTLQSMRFYNRLLTPIEREALFNE